MVRGIPVPDRHDFPPAGSIVPGVAAGFLVCTDTAICFIEGYITNPDVDSETRDKALDMITEHLIYLAGTFGYTHAVVMTVDARIEERANKWGFTKKPAQQLLVKEL